MTAPLVFVDTETDGLHHGRRVWEIAMIRRDDTGERERSFFVGLDLRNSDAAALNIGRFWDRHPAGRKISGKGTSPQPGPPPLCKHDAAREVMTWTFGATLVGVGVHFDAETLAGLLRAEGYLPAWHYALVDVKAMAAGWLNGRHSDPRIRLTPPWKSEELSLMIGVNPPDDRERHTALGDARWAQRMYDRLTGGTH